MQRKEIDRIRARNDYSKYVSDMDIAEDVLAAYERCGTDRFPFCNCEIVARMQDGDTVFEVAQ